MLAITLVGGSSSRSRVFSPIELGEFQCCSPTEFFQFHCRLPAGLLLGGVHGFLLGDLTKVNELKRSPAPMM
jgi:hypothetical protein